MKKSIPTVWHLEKDTMNRCEHKGGSWNVALALTMQCTGASATTPQRNEIVQQLLRGESVWLDGNLLHGELT